MQLRKERFSPSMQLLDREHGWATSWPTLLAPVRATEDLASNGNIVFFFVAKEKPIRFFRDRKCRFMKPLCL